MSTRQRDVPLTPNSGIGWSLSPGLDLTQLQSKGSLIAGRFLKLNIMFPIALFEASNDAAQK